ncbi:MAG: hypothetical protein IBX47_10180 [Desulfuromonadales bacterium]|nr:hypothetical protein [Desulfuromonadales bacterium]
MKKLVMALVALAAIVAVATPALAEFKVNGYYRLQATGQSLTPAENTESFIDNRLRLMATNTLNDNISVVYFAEIDTPWGEQSKSSIGNGGQVGTDGVNVETKNAYVHFKLPDTSWSVRTGLLGWGTGNPFESLVVHDDMAGINVVGDMGPIKTNFVYSKFNEGVRDAWDDIDFYGLNLGIKASDTVGLTGFLGYLDNNAADNTNMYVGLNGDVKIADIGLEAFILYKNQSSDLTGGVEGSAYAADLKGKIKMPFGNIKAHVAYFSADDDATDKNTFDPSYGAFEYHNDNLMIFLTDVYYNNGSQGALALKNAAYAGYGLMFLTVSGDVKLGNDMYAKYGAGYFTATDDKVDGGPVSKAGKDLGFEVDAMIGKKFAEKYDVSLRGAYGVMGDFYKVGAVDADDVFKVVAMVNVGF